MPFLDNNRPDALWYQISTFRFPPWHPLLTAQKTCFHHHTGTQLHPHPHHHLGSSSVRGHKRDLQLFQGHFLYTVVCYPPTPSFFLIPSTSAHFFLLFHLGALFLSKTMTRGGSSVAFATILIRADGTCRFHCTLLA